MKIDTKYSISNKVYFLKDDAVHQGVIIGVNVSVLSDMYGCISEYMYYDIKCTNKTYNHISEKSIFKTKQELLDSL